MTVHVSAVGPHEEAAVGVARSLPSVEDVCAGAGAGAGVRGDVLLDGFDPDRKVSIVGAVIDACEQAGAGRPGLAEATALVEHLPAVLCRDVPATQAAHIQRHLEEVGASTRFQRSHD